MEHKVTIVALTKFLEVWSAFRRNIATFVPKDVSLIVVVDGDKVKPTSPWQVIRGPKTFSMAGNYNIGMLAADPESDLLLLNDDITFLTPDPVQRLQELAYSAENIGAVACRVAQGRVGNPLQERPRQDRPLTLVKTCGNGCTYFRRDMIRQVGWMDEDLAGAYGAEDADYTWRINLAGYRVAISRDVHVKHGFGQYTHSVTSIRTLQQDLQKTNVEGVKRWEEKWGLPFRVVHGEWREEVWATTCPHHALDPQDLK